MRTLILLVLITLVFPAYNLSAGILNTLSETDHPNGVFLVPFDLRERESFLQVTNTDPDSQNIHIQIYDVSNLCNENNFFDVYTPNDTHIYDLRNILTNDGNPSGVDLPDDAYGIIVVSPPFIPFEVEFGPFLGNIRIIDNLGYEYRTNGVGSANNVPSEQNNTQVFFNYNSQAGIILSDVFGIAVSTDQESVMGGVEFEATLDNVLSTWIAVDVDIINNNEVLFSCRDVVFSCVDENNPLIEEILALASSDLDIARSSASVARFEYGINNAVPHSKGGELLCPGNNIPEGIVILTPENGGRDTSGFFGYVGLNNGNGRGAFDSFFYPNNFIQDPNQ